MDFVSEFSPNWLSPPGASVSDILEERGVSVREFAEQVGCDIRTATQFLMGSESVSVEFAANLARVVGSTKDFWLRREETYVRERQRISSSDSVDELHSWLDSIPVGLMIREGWLSRKERSLDLAQAALAFFGVPSLAAWRAKYVEGFGRTAYRTSSAVRSVHGAVAYWSRQGEILAREIECEPWSPEKFQLTLKEVRALTRLRNPEEFLPELQKLCAASGVAIVPLKAPTGCPVSGAVSFTSPNKALMLLSFRYLTDDQFWFTFFHEAGHLLLHARRGWFMEGLENVLEDAEAEADRFAEIGLLGEDGHAYLQTLPRNHFAIARFAKRIGVSPGVVVGILQRAGRVPYKHFNRLKVFYTWS